MIQRAPNDPAWYKGGLYHDDEPFGVPSLWMMSWYDVSIGPNLALFNHVTMRTRPIRKSPTISSPWWRRYPLCIPACRQKRPSSESATWVTPVTNMTHLTYGWFDYWLKGEENGITEKTPKVQYYTMGKNKWQSSATWPPEGAEMVTYYLDGAGKANSLYGDGKLTTSEPGKKTSPTRSPMIPSIPFFPTEATSAAPATPSPPAPSIREKWKPATTFSSTPPIL